MTHALAVLLMPAVTGPATQAEAEGGLVAAAPVLGFVGPSG
jgi:hypothetical protein